MRRFSVLSSVACLALALVAVGCSDNNNDDARVFAATPLTGANTVPPSGSGATGSASLELTGSSMQFSIQLSAIEGVTGAHLHSGGSTGSGPVRVTLFSDSGTGPINGILISDSFAAGDVVGGMSFDDLVDQMRSGQIYLDVHTLQNPGGSVRAQVQPVE
jgi:hypothetical protein